MSNPVQTIEVFPTQLNFLTSASTFTLFSGGRGSGKTFAGALWAVIMTQKYPKCVGLICGNTYQQIRKAIAPAIRAICKLMNLRFRYVPATSTIEIGNVVCDIVSAENYDSSGRGSNIGWAWFDESAFYKEEAFLTFLGSIRDPNGPCQVRLTTTPVGYNWLYTFFIEKTDQTKKVIYASTKQNPFVDDLFYETLENVYDDKLLAQETEGKFVNLQSGQVYYSFLRENLTNFEVLPNEQIYVGMDFNVNPLTAVVAVKRQDKLYIFDELYLENSNTFQAAPTLMTRFGKRLTIHPDSTGSSRKTSSQKTDHLILKDAGFTLDVKHNPAIGDRLNCVNGLISKNRVVIHPRCVRLVKDLEQLTHNNTDKMLSHISDALGYLCWAHFPLKKPQNTQPLTNPFLRKI